MKGEFLSRQLSFLPEDMVEDAMAPDKEIRRKHTWHQVVRVAACLAVIIGLLLGVPLLMPGTDSRTESPLVIKGFAIDEEGGYQEIILSPETDWYPWSTSSNVIPGLPFFLSVTSDDYNEKDISFRVRANGGALLVGEAGCTRLWQGRYPRLPNDGSVANNTMVYWKSVKKDAAGNYIGFYDKQNAYIEVIVYEKDRIIGYAVLLVTHINPDKNENPCYSISLLTNEAFSEKEQNSGKITEEYVRSLMQEGRHQ